MKALLIAIAVTVCFVGFARAQDDANTTDTTCPPEPTCPPVQDCTCPPVTECPTTESTRTRTRRPGPRTRAEGTRTRPPGPRTRAEGTRTRPPGPRTRAEGTRTRSPGPRTRAENTNRTRTDTGPGRSRTRTGPGRSRTRTDTETTNTTRTDTRTGGPRTRAGRTRSPRPPRTPRPRDCTPKLPPGCEDRATTGPVVFTTTETPSSPTPQNVASCSSAVIDATGQREIPMIALQFHISENDPYTFASEAQDFEEIIALLAAESGQLDTVNAAVLGISAGEDVLSVTVAVSFNMTANKVNSQSSSQIVNEIYDNLDALREYYNVKDMKTLKMDAQSLGSSGDLTDSKASSKLPESSVAAIVVSVLAMIGILCALTLLTVKLSTRLSQKPNEKRPLLEEDRGDESRKTGTTVTWQKQNDTITF